MAIYFAQPKMEHFSLDKFIDEARRLPTISLNSAQSYQTMLDPMVEQVDIRLTALKNIDTLIGHNPLQLMYDNHRHHGIFMATVFHLNGYELLARTLIWVYRAYSSHGFSYDYFPQQLMAWQKAIEQLLPDNQNSGILGTYDWVLKNHETIIRLSETSDAPLPVTEQWVATKNSFLNSILEGDHRQSLTISRDYLEQTKSLQSLYMQIIQPAMYEVGHMWERAEISVAQEHLASAVVSRVLASVNSLSQNSLNRKGKVVITAAEGELHEIGAWMISDIFQLEGWEIRYLGANTPGKDVISLMESYLPDVLAISVTMPFNIMKVKSLTDKLRKDVRHTLLKVMVGGRVFIDNPELCNSINSDAFASNVDEATHLIRSWSRSV